MMLQRRLPSILRPQTELLQGLASGAVVSRYMLNPGKGLTRRWWRMSRGKGQPTGTDRYASCLSAVAQR